MSENCDAKRVCVGVVLLGTPSPLQFPRPQALPHSTGLHPHPTVMSQLALLPTPSPIPWTRQPPPSQHHLMLSSRWAHLLPMRPWCTPATAISGASCFCQDCWRKGPSGVRSHMRARIRGRPASEMRTPQEGCFWSALVYISVRCLSAFPGRSIFGHRVYIKVALRRSG